MNETSSKPWLEGVRGTQVLPIINCDDEIIRVEAGPGTGKTFGLVRRVQRILHPQGLGVPGREVLVVAFNRVIAKQLRQDIEENLEATSNSEMPVIQTVHALCLQVLGSNLRILLPHEREAMIYDVIKTHANVCQKYKPHLSNRFHSNVDQALRNHEAKHKEDDDLWQAVRQWLKRHQAELISELPNLVLDRIQGGDFQDRTYQHVIVDEFQDLTQGEQLLFLKLKKEGGTFMALGDERQSIYAFRGNDRKGLKNLDCLVAPFDTVVKDIPMTECRRCPDQIVDAANRLMSLYESKKLISVSEERANPYVVVWKSYQAEAKGMATAIIENIRENPQDNHLAMVTRRKFGYKLREEMLALDSDLNIELSFSESLLETWPVREAFLFFCLLVDPDPPTWRAWLGYQNSRDGNKFKAPERNAGAYLKLLTKCDDEITAIAIENIANCSKQSPGSGGKILWVRAKRFVELKNRLSWDGTNALALILEIFDASKWDVDQLSDPDTVTQAIHDMDQARAKASEICHEFQSENPDSTTQQQLKEVASRLRYQIATREPFVSDEKTDLNVATLWGAKGITADHVYVIGLCGEAIPGEMREEYPGTLNEFNEEQRRLFYVSITRSKKTLVLSRARRMQRGDAARFGLSPPNGNELAMCPFQRDTGRSLPNAQNGEVWRGVLGHAK